MVPARTSLAALLLLVLLPAARAEEERSMTLLKPPSLGGPSKPAGAAEPDEFRLGVSEYVRKNDAAAIAHLRKALERAPSDEKTRRLLLKVYFRAIQEKINEQDLGRALGYLKEARGYFPEDPEMKALSNSIGGEPPAPPPAKTAPVPAAVPAAKKPRRELAPPAPDPAAAFESEAPPPARPAPRRSDPAGRLAWTAAAAALLLLAAQGASAQSLKRRLARLEAELRREEAGKRELAIRLEAERDAQRRAEEGWRAETQRLFQEIDRRERETRRLVEDRELQRQREEAERLRKEPRGRSDEKRWVARQEKAIAETLVNLTPPEREEESGRIAAQAVTLYETSPAEAVRYLQRLARDPNRLTRLIIVPALARIADPGTWDLLIELLEDKDAEVKREALKSLKGVLRSEPCPLTEAYKQRFAARLREELEKAEWVF